MSLPHTDLAAVSIGTNTRSWASWELNDGGAMPGGAMPSGPMLGAARGPMPASPLLRQNYFKGIETAK